LGEVTGNEAEETQAFYGKNGIDNNRDSNTGKAVGFIEAEITPGEAHTTSPEFPPFRGRFISSNTCDPDAGQMACVKKY
jgi:hypothetical protein